MLPVKLSYPDGRIRVEVDEIRGTGWSETLILGVRDVCPFRRKESYCGIAHRVGPRGGWHDLKCPESYTCPSCSKPTSKKTFRAPSECPLRQSSVIVSKRDEVTVIHYPEGFKSRRL
jgi:hypothetical protein